ncbi:acyl-CoA dehydrogenase family protein [Kitasatospora sp. NPDC048540]|uniref:acyl-CoA dehydrogenase family protein n=1 Tax=Kitasatospora sp. NPDC048540 TaxID=3155634 RepID=UPI003409F01C
MSEHLSTRPRTARLEALLGDPLAPGNPLGLDAVVAADERAELPAAGVRALDTYGFNAELVPAALGGRLTRADELAEAFRTVARRDLGLAAGYGLGSLTAGLHVWRSGNPGQQAALAALLLGDRRVATAHAAPGAGLRATRDGGELVVSGSEHLVGDPAAAEAILLPVTLDGGTAHLLLPADPGLTVSPPHSGTGLRGCRFSAVRADGLRVSADRLVGTDGAGRADAAAVRRITGTVVASALAGVLDTELRTALSFADERILYGRPVTGLPSARALLADAFLDLLIADCCTTVAARALHLHPGRATYQSTAQHLVAGLVRDAVHQLSLLLGARSYLREGPHAVFQKHLRDRTALAALHGSPPPAAPPAGPAEEPLTALFEAAGQLPALDLALIGPAATGPDALAATLGALPAELADRHPELVALAAPLAGDPGGTGFAAAACLRLWWHGHAGRDGFLGRPDWIHAALHRLAARTGRPAVPAAADRDPLLLEELRTRLQQGRTFDLADRPPAR